MNPKKTTTRRRRLVTGGVIAAGLSVAGAGAAMAAAPGSPLADVIRGFRAEEPAVPTAEPVAITEAQSEAFWGAGYTGEDLAALSALWQKDMIETKALAGQMLIDGQTVPVAPGTTPVAPGNVALGDETTDWSTLPDGYTQPQYEAFWGAGYTVEDLTALSTLWQKDEIETKALAGQMLLDGQTVPVAPGSTPFAP